MNLAPPDTDARLDDSSTPELDIAQPDSQRVTAYEESLAPPVGSFWRPFGKRPSSLPEGIDTTAEQAYFPSGSVTSNRVLLCPPHVKCLRDAIAVARRVVFSETAARRTAYALARLDEVRDWTTASDFEPGATIDDELLDRIRRAKDSLKVSFYIDERHVLGEAGVFASEPLSIGLDFGLIEDGAQALVRLGDATTDDPTYLRVVFMLANIIVHQYQHILRLNLQPTAETGRSVPSGLGWWMERALWGGTLLCCALDGGEIDAYFIVTQLVITAVNNRRRRYAQVSDDTIHAIVKGTPNLRSETGGAGLRLGTPGWEALVGSRLAQADWTHARPEGYRLRGPDTPGSIVFRTADGSLISRGGCGTGWYD